jgi:hypothetical protein
MSAQVTSLNGLLVGGQTVLMAASVTLAFMIFIDAVKLRSPAAAADTAPVSIENCLETALRTPGP